MRRYAGPDGTINYAPTVIDDGVERPRVEFTEDELEYVRALLSRSGSPPPTRGCFHDGC